jgi:uncharacterized protein (UPF0262 family)
MGDKVEPICSSFYSCIREAYELAEAIADQLALIIAAMDYREGNDADVLLATYIALQQVVVDLYSLIERVKQAIRIMRGEDLKALDS